MKWPFYLDLPSGHHSVRVLSEVKQKKNVCSRFTSFFFFFSGRRFYFSANSSFTFQLNGHCWMCWANETKKNGKCYFFQFHEMKCNAINLLRYAVPFMCHISMWTVRIESISVQLGICCIYTRSCAFQKYIEDWCSKFEYAPLNKWTQRKWVENKAARNGYSV